MPDPDSLREQHPFCERASRLISSQTYAHHELPALLARHSPQIRLDDFHWAFGQCLHECAAVGFGRDAVIEDNDNAVVSLGSD